MPAWSSTTGTSGRARTRVPSSQSRTGQLVVPQLFWRDRHIVGFDPDALAELVAEYRGA